MSDITFSQTSFGYRADLIKYRFKYWFFGPATEEVKTFYRRYTDARWHGADGQRLNVGDSNDLNNALSEWLMRLAIERDN